MAHSGQSVVQFPISGSDQVASIPGPVFVRVVQQVSSATLRLAYHPGGGMTTAVQLAPRNVNRVRYTLLNSGTLPLLVDHGHGTFNPNAPPVAGSHWDNIIPGTNQQQGNQSVQQSLAYEGPLPCYTGPVYVAWAGSGTLSGSVAVFTEYEEQR